MKILMITTDFPFPPIDGLRLKVYHMLKGLSIKHEIFLLAFIDSTDKIDFGEIKSFCEHIELIPKNPRKFLILKAIFNLFERKPFSLKTFNSNRMKERLKEILEQEEFDIVHLDIANTTQFFDLVAHMPTFMAPHDSMTLNLRRRVKFERNPFQKAYQYIQSKKWERYEKEMYVKFDKCFVVSDVDKETLQTLNPKIDISVAPNGVDTNFFKPLNLKEEYPSLIFSGSMGSFQSCDAILFFYKEMYGRIKKIFPDIKLYIVGKNPPPKVKKLSNDSSVTVTGFVEDIRQYIDKSTVYICPIRSGSGIKNRLLEAMAMKKPIVAFRRSCEALNVSHRENILIANDQEEFANGIIELLHDKELRNYIAMNAMKLIEREYSWDYTIQIIENSYFDAIKKKAHPSY